MRDAVDPRLLRRMEEAARHVPLYRRLWAVSGVTPDLAGAVRLDKKTLRDCAPDERIYGGRRRRKLASELSSGSSGEPLRVLIDRRALLARRFAFLRALVACGYRPGQRALLLTSRRGAKASSALFGWHYADISEGTETLAGRAAELRPRLLYGPLSTLELLAEHLARHRMQWPELRLVVSTAEQLTPARLRLLADGFGAPVADFYGMAEFGLVAYRRPGEREYRPARSSLVFEYDPVPGDDAIEQLVLSDLAERTAPLLRYETGDHVERDCALPHRPIVGFAGRAFDCLLLPGGRRISPYCIDVALEALPELRGFEVVQQRDLSIDVTIEAAPVHVEPLRAAIAVKLAAVLGGDVPFRIAAGTIGRPADGRKFRPIRSVAGAVA